MLTNEQLGTRLSETCVGLAKHIARRICRTFDYWDESELESVAMLALCKAERTFDASIGIKFSSWAGLVMERHIKAEIYKQRRRIMPSIFNKFDFGYEVVRGVAHDKDNDMLLDLITAIKQLPPGQASLVRAFLNGEEVRDVARQRGVSKSAGSQQFRLAVKRLRAILG